MPLITFSGIASGIDTDSLLQAIQAAEDQARQPLEDEISRLQDTNSAFDDLTERLNDVRTAAQSFRSINGGGLSKQGTSTDETVASAEASNGAVNGSYSVSVLSVAKSSNGSFDDSDITSSGAAIAPTITDTGNSNITITIGQLTDQESIVIPVTSTTTLSDLAASFNSQSTKGVASVINIGSTASPQYRIVFSSVFEGTAKGELAVAVGSDITSVVPPLGGRFNAQTISQATDATFTISGINGTITRASNNVADVIPGVTLKFNKIGSTTVSVTDDITSTIATIQEFVDTYNELVEFISENDQVVRDSDTDLNTFLPLASTSVDNNALTQLRQAFSQAQASGTTEIRILADLGITTNRDGTLRFVPTGASSALTDLSFEQALAKEPNSVREILEELGELLAAPATAGGIIDQLTGFNQLIDRVQEGNTNLIGRIEDRLDRRQAATDARIQSLRESFARLESRIGELNSQQSQLASILG